MAVCRQAGARPAAGAERLALRAGQGRRAAGPGGPAGPRGRGRAGLRQHGRRPGRAGLRRRLDPGRPRTARCWPAGRSSRRRWSSRTWTCRPRRPRTLPGEQPVDAAGRHGDHDQAGGAAGRREPGAGEPRDPGEAFWPRLSDPAEVYAALVTGVRDYVRKNGFRSVILALSGGIDSALTATIAADAIGAGPRARGADAQPLLLRALGHRRRGPGQAAGRARGDDPDRLDGRRVHRGARPGRVPRDRAARGEPAGPGARRGADGAVQRGRAPGPHHGQQERAGHRLLHAVRGLGRRVRPDQGRVQDAGLGAGPVAQRRGGPAGGRLPRSRRTPSPSRRAPSWRRGSSTPTRCRRTRCSTRCSTTTWRRTWAAPS